MLARGMSGARRRLDDNDSGAPSEVSVIVAQQLENSDAAQQRELRNDQRQAAQAAEREATRGTSNGKSLPAA